MCYMFYLDSFAASSRNLSTVARKKKDRWEFLRGIQENLMESNSKNIAGSEEH